MLLRGKSEENIKEISSVAWVGKLTKMEKSLDAIEKVYFNKTSTILSLLVSFIYLIGSLCNSLYVNECRVG